MCNLTCKKCEYSENNCTECKNLYLLNSFCLSTCPEIDYWASNETWSCNRCNVKCEKCFAATEHNCTKCKSSHFLLNSTCYLECPVSYWGDSTVQLCQNCHSTCQTCYGNDSSTCTSCSSNYKYFIDNNTCLSDCPSLHFWYNSSNNTCMKCLSYCVNCIFESSGQKCYGCQADKFLLINNFSCVDACPAYTYVSEHTCEPCDEKCYNCSGPGDHNCSNCKQNQVYATTGECLSNCPDTFYNMTNLTTQLFQCEPCHNSCQVCSNNSSNACITCASPLIFHQNSCLTECPLNFYAENNLVCLNCHSICLKCFGNFSNNCSSCVPNLIWFNNTCLSAC